MFNVFEVFGKWYKTIAYEKRSTYSFFKLSVLQTKNCTNNYAVADIFTAHGRQH